MCMCGWGGLVAAAAAAATLDGRDDGWIITAM